MDILDVSGEVQSAITTGIQKTRLDENGKDISSHQVLYITGPDGKQTQISESERDRKIREMYEAKGPDYCGSCWGSAPEDAKKCCNTCEDVRMSYREVGWAFNDGSGIEQCENEGYSKWIQETKNEGCNIAGVVKVNKVAGNFHFAPGASLTFDGRHSHDLSLYARKDLPYSFSHIIHHLSFGPSPFGDTSLIQDDDEKRVLAEKEKELSRLINHSKQEKLLVNPLNGVMKVTENKQFTYQYFLKVVATRYELYGRGNLAKKTNIHAAAGSIEKDRIVIDTNQYSATSHERDVSGGRDEDHPHTMHERGGVPGVYFTYDISPMKIINREERSKTFGTFLSGICSIVGAAVTIGAIIDFGVWEADKALRRRKER